jgi:hypothetical protein
MKFIRRKTKYAWKDYKTNNCILSELTINPDLKADGRFGSRLRDYHPFVPTPLRYGPVVHRLQFRPSSPEALHVKQHERSLLVKGGIGREMAGQFGLWFRLPRKSQGSFTCRKSATWDRRLYFHSEGRHAVDFFAPKIRWHWPGSNPRSWVPEASMLTTRPPPSCKEN